MSEIRPKFTLSAAARRCAKAAGRTLPADRRGIAALEYGLLASIVSAAVIVSAFHYAPAEESLFSAISLTVSRVTGSLAAGAGGGATGGGQSGSGSGSQGGGSGEDDGGSGR